MSYHRETTLHCDHIYRRSSMDGWKFDGKEELFLKHASVPDVWIEPDGKHIVVFNDVETEKLASTAELQPEKLWQQGLVGYGGLGMAIDEFDSTLVERIEVDLNLPTPMEVVDPDIGRDRERLAHRMVWGVTIADESKCNMDRSMLPSPIIFTAPPHQACAHSQLQRQWSKAEGKPAALTPQC